MKQALAAMTLAAGISSAPVNAEMNDNQPVVTEINAKTTAILDCKKSANQLKTQFDAQQLLEECKKQAGVVLDMQDYKENQNNPEVQNNFILHGEIQKSDVDFNTATFGDLLSIPYTVSESDPAAVFTPAELRELFSNIILARLTGRQEAWEEKIMSLENHPQKELILGFINSAIKNIKIQFADEPNKLPTNVPQIYLEKAITASISSLTNTDKELVVSENYSEEFVLRYFTDLTIALYLKGDLSEDEIQVLEQSLPDGNVAYFSTFKLTDKTVPKLLAVTDFEKAQKIALAMSTLNKNITSQPNVAAQIQDTQEINTVSLEGVHQDYLGDVEKYPVELQRIFMDIFNTYAPNLSGMDLDDLHYELTGTFNAVDNNPTRALEEAQYVQDNFGWDLTPFLEYAQDKKTAQDERMAQHDIEMKKGEEVLAKEKGLLAKEKGLLAKEKGLLAKEKGLLANHQNNRIRIQQDTKELKESQQDAKKILAMLNGN